MIVIEGDGEYSSLTVHLLPSAPEVIASAMEAFAGVVGEDDCGPFALLRKHTEYTEEPAVQAVATFHDAVGLVASLAELEGGYENHSPYSYNTVVDGLVRVLQITHHSEELSIYKFLHSAVTAKDLVRLTLLLTRATIVLLLALCSFGCSWLPKHTVFIFFTGHACDCARV